MNQLSIFQPKVDDKAQRMLDAINEGRKRQELYGNMKCFHFGPLNVYLVHNGYGHLLGNILDEDGNTPKGFSANWRAWFHIKQELGL